MGTTTVPEWTLVDFIHRGHWWRHHGILILNLCLCLPLITSWSNGLDSSLVNGLQILPGWQSYFHHPESKLLGLLNSAQNIGFILGLAFTPFACDSLGRKPTLMVGAVITLGGIAMQSASPTVYIFIIARVLVGFGLTFSMSASPLLITELAYPTQRGKMAALYNSGWYIGSIITAWACFAVYNRVDAAWTWRIPTLIQAFAPILQICLCWFIPESPRFLMSKGFESKAARVLAHFHANDDVRDPLVVFELAQIRHALRQDKELSVNQPLSILWATPGNRKRMRIIIAIAVFSQWSGNGLVSYYIDLIFESVGITVTSTKLALNGGLQVWNLTCALIGSMLVERLGRRTLFIASNAGMLIVFGVWTLTVALFNGGNKDAGKATVPLIFLFYFFYDIAYTPMLVAYTLEILPFHIRAKGFAVMNLTVSCTVAFNQFVNPWALESIGWKYYLVYDCFLIFELVFILRYVIETKGRTLEETAALFDGEPIALVQTGGEAATRSRIVLQHEQLSKRQTTIDQIEMARVSSSDSDEEIRQIFRQKMGHLDGSDEERYF